MKKYTTTVLLSLATLAATAQNVWIDVTDTYIINPRFDNNDLTTGWVGTAFGAASPRENAEHYSKTYNTYQTINGLAKGRYRLSLDAFYRMGNSSDDYSAYTSNNYADRLHAKLYATSSTGNYETSIVPASSAALSQSLGGGVANVGNGGWWGGEVLYIPNNMEAAYYWFEAGYYNNSVECEVGSDGILTIGIKKDQLINADWTCIDNWQLEYYGQLVDASSITLSQTDVNLIKTEVYNLTATVMPENATYRNVTWTSTNTSVATVDSKGEITAVGNGTCYIVATSKSNSNVTARCKVTVTSTTAKAENIVINEIMAANVDVYMDPSFNYGSWVELYNPTGQGVMLGGLYVSDDPNNLKKHKLIDSYGALPAHGYAIINFDHFDVYTQSAYRQINDDLDCDGGTIIISDGTNILAQQTYPQAISRTSYARTSDGSDTWGVAAYPTPGTSNNESMGFAASQLDAPVVDKDAQLFNGQMQVCVSIPEGATLKYTTDGTTPTRDNGEVSETGLFSVTSTTCFRFRLFRDGYLPSPVVTRSYIENNGNYPFSIVSIVTDKNNIYSTEYGVFQQGNNGRPGRGQSGNCNWNMEWDRPVAFDFITKNNECIVSQECNFAMCGGWSRAWTPHSFKLKANKAYDLKNIFEAPLFEKKPYIKNKTLQIRNGGNDNYARVKDPALQMLVANSGLYVDYQEWEPVHVFINGAYYNVLNMREPNNKHFAYSNYGIDTDEMDQFEMSPDSGYVQMEGTDEAFNRLVELSKNANDEDTYNEICQLLDIDEYANYTAVEFYLGGNDWPQNNIKGFRDVNGGKFHFVLFDLDGALGTDDPFNSFFSRETYTFDRLYGYDYSQQKNIDNTRLTKNIAFVTLFKNMLKNDTFRRKFIDAFCIMGGSVFQPKYVQKIIGEVADKLAEGGVYPYDTSNYLINQLGSADYNSKMSNRLKSCSQMKLSSVTRQSVSISSNSSDGRIELNGMTLPYNEFEGFLYAPVTVKAIAPAGYAFAGWTSSTSASTSTLFNESETWSYYDGGSLDGMSWNATSYSTTGWSSGKAPIGYGKNQATTTASYLPCYYFRKSFTLSQTPSASDVYTLHFTVDDGAVVYINGREAGRYNMPSGNTYYNTLASTYAPNNPDDGEMTIDPSLLKKGSNTIAVEVHNNSTASSDILWNASLTMTKEVSSSSDYVSTDTEYTLPASGTQKLIAMFEKVSDEDMIAQGITPVRINEVSAANTMYVNDYFKKNDWIELYNTTDDAIDIAGMYVSDNLKKPEKYQVPTDDVTLNTVIPAHGYKVIWCDKLDNIGTDIHTSFKLAADGGDMLIKTDNYADTLTYTAHIGTESFGRYPDGTNDTYVMRNPSIGKTNQLSSYDTQYEAPSDPDPIIPDDIASYKKESGVSIAYTEGVINVKSEDANIKSVSVYSAAGVKAAASVRMKQGERYATVMIQNMPKGIYVVRVITSENDEYSMKFGIK